MFLNIQSVLGPLLEIELEEIARLVAPKETLNQD